MYAYGGLVHVCIICLSLCVGPLITVVSGQTIICDSTCLSNKDRRPSSNNDSSDCKVEDVEKTPYPNENATTALNPTWQSYSWYIYIKADGHKAVAFNLTWNQSANNAREFVDGYFISIKDLRGGMSVNYLRVFKTTFPVTISNQVVVNYPCFGRSVDEEVEPGHTYLISLTAMPLYHQDSDDLSDNEWLYVPDCEEDDEMLETEYCKNRPQYDDDCEDCDDDDNNSETTTVSTRDEDSVFSWSLILLLFLFCIVALAVSIALYICYKKRRQVLTNSSVLVVVSTHGSEDRSFWDISANLANVLSKYSNLSLTLNVWELAANTDAVDWMAEKLQFHNHIVLVCSPLGKKNWDHGNKDDAFVLGLQKILHLKRKALLNLSPSHNYTVIYFDNDERISIPEVLNKNGIKYLKIPEDLGKFYRKISGGKNGNFSKSDIADLNKLVFTLRSNGEKYYSANSRCDMTASVTDDENSRVSSAIVSMSASDSKGNTMSTDLCSEEREIEALL